MPVIQPRRRLRTTTLTAGALMLIGVPFVHAERVTDKANDFLPNPPYIGPHDGDLDALSSEVTLDTGKGTLTFTATVNGAVGSTPGAAWVWGLDRGKGTEQFQPAFGAGVKFDSVVALTLNPAQPSAFIDLIGGVTLHPLAPGSVHVTGNTISATVPLSMIPSEGFAAKNYTWNFWPEAILGQPSYVSDFAPDARNAALTVVPEPSSGLLGLGGVLIALGIARWKRRAG